MALSPRLARSELAALACDLWNEPFAPAGIDTSEVLGEHVFMNRVLADRDAEAIERMARLETEWSLNEKWFLSKHDAVWTGGAALQHVPVDGVRALDALWRVGHKLIEANYNTVLGARFEIKATRMGAGQWVGIHNDSPEGARGLTENYRLLFYPNKQYADQDGGHLLFYSPNEPHQIVAAVRPLFNSGVLMRLSNTSYHAVAEVRASVRFTVATLYWGYPILHHEDHEKKVIDKCLREIIALGCEKVPHAGTTLAYHLYHTYRLLTEWEAPFSTCVAGLMGGVATSWRPDRGTRIDTTELQQLVDEPTMRVISALKQKRPESDTEQSDRDAEFIRLAAVLERAIDSDGIAQGQALMANMDGLDDRVAERIECELARLRADITFGGS